MIALLRALLDAVLSFTEFLLFLFSGDESVDF